MRFEELIIIGLLALGAASLAEGADLYAEIGAGYNTALGQVAHPWNNGGCVGFYGALRGEHKLSPKVTLVGQYIHVSQWDCGPPFNDKAESSLDHFGIALRFKLGTL